jgi:hypothetical protein
VPGIAAFYAWWYPTRWFGDRHHTYAELGPLAHHIRYADRTSRRLARAIFHGMVRYGPRLERKQAFLFRTVDIAMELFVMSVTVARAHALRQQQGEGARGSVELADSFARRARSRIGRLFHDLWSNDDALLYRLGQEVLGGEHEWMERGTIHLAYEAADLKPPTVREILARRLETEPLPAAAEAEIRAG